eukprot:g13881.t1
MSGSGSGNESSSSHYNNFFPDGAPPSKGKGENAGGNYPRGNEPDWHFRGNTGSMHGTPSLYGRREYTNETRELPSPVVPDRFPTLTAELQEQERVRKEKQLNNEEFGLPEPMKPKAQAEGESKRLRNDEGADRGVSDSLTASLHMQSTPGPGSISHVEEATRGIVMSQRAMLDAAMNLEGNIQGDNAAVERAMNDFQSRLMNDQQVLEQIAQATGQQQLNAVEMRDRILSSEHAVGNALKSLTSAAVQREVDARKIRDQMQARDQQFASLQQTVKRQDERFSAQDEKLSQLVNLVTDLAKSRSRSRSNSNAASPTEEVRSEQVLGMQQVPTAKDPAPLVKPPAVVHGMHHPGQTFVPPPPPKAASAKGMWGGVPKGQSQGVYDYVSPGQWPAVDPTFQGVNQTRQVPPVPFGAAIPGHPGSTGTMDNLQQPMFSFEHEQSQSSADGWYQQQPQQPQQLPQLQQLVSAGGKPGRKGQQKGRPVGASPFDNMGSSPDGAWLQTDRGEWKMRPTPGLIRADDLVHSPDEYDEPELTLTSSGLMGTLPAFSFKLESEMILSGEGEVTDDRKRARITTKDVVALLKPFNPKESLIKHHAKISGAIKACMSGGPYLGFASENAIAQVGIMEHCHQQEERKLILRFGMIKDGRDKTHTLRAYFMTLMQMFPELSSEAHDKIQAWSVSGGGWLKKGANLLAELLRMEEVAHDVGFNLFPTGYVQQLFVLYEVSLRIYVPAGIQRQTQFLWRVPICTFAHMKEYAKNDRNATTSLAVADIKDSQAMFARQVGDVIPGAGQALSGNDDLGINSVCEPVGEEVIPDNALVAAPVRPAYPKHGGKGGQRRPSQTSISTVQKYPCANCGSMEHFTRNCPKPRQCRICGAPDHISTSCPENKANARKILFAKFVRQTRDKKFNGKRPNITVRSLLENGETVDEVELFSSEDLEKLFGETQSETETDSAMATMETERVNALLLSLFD